MLTNDFGDFVYLGRQTVDLGLQFHQLVDLTLMKMSDLNNK